MAQGRDNARLFLKDNPTVCDEVEARIRADVEEQKRKQDAEAEQKRLARQQLAASAGLTRPAEIVRESESAEETTKEPIPEEYDE